MKVFNGRNVPWKINSGSRGFCACFLWLDFSISSSPEDEAFIISCSCARFLFLIIWMSFLYMEFSWNAHLSLLPAADLLKIYWNIFCPENGHVFCRLSNCWIQKSWSTLEDISVPTFEYNKIVLGCIVQMADMDSCQNWY